MFGIAKTFFKKEPDTHTPEQKELIAEYRTVIEKMHHARNAFQNVTEPKLIESCVHEMNALQAQYSFLLEKLKDENLTGDTL